MYNQRPITTHPLFDEEIIAASGVATSYAVPLADIAQDGIFSLENILTGDGTGKVTYLICSTKGGTFVTPDADGQPTAGEIKEAQTVGTFFAQFGPCLAPFIKIVITETGGANGIVASTWLNIQ